ncbi:MAG: aldehyde dehydrogenase family protein [Verrucomicrobiae bacterium]|nr:aldehyde dehydrogenase family protein [Verrucomicrobiae bacterium]
MKLTCWKNRSPGDTRIELPEVCVSNVESCVQRAHEAAVSWAHLPLEKRMDYVRKIQTGLKEIEEELARGIALETGKPLKESRSEMGAVLMKFDLSIDDAQRWLKPEDVHEGPHPAKIVRRAQGPAAVIGPFNFPLHLPNGAAVPHLLAGNPVLLKPSPVAAVVAERYGKVFESILPPGVFQLIQGGAEESMALCLHPLVRSVNFTGSVTVGKILSRALAEDFSKHLALELGGKNALIVCEDADVVTAAQAAAEGICLTAGQRCNATSRILVNQKVAKPFYEALVEVLKKYQPGDPMKEETILGPVINEKAHQRFEKVLSLNKDGEWLVKGAVEKVVDGKPGYYVRPAVWLWRDRNKGLKSALHCEEVFAPIAEVYEVADVADAIAMHETTPFGLTASIFTQSEKVFRQFADALNVGNLYANLATTFSPSTLPFGGVGESGNRRPAGRHFIRFTTEEQAIQIPENSFSE